MKNYIFLFLLFWFNVSFAPTSTSTSGSDLERSTLNEKSVEIEKIESQKDSLDLIILKKYKMTKVFSKKEDIRKVRMIADSLGTKTKYLYKIFYIEMDKVKGVPVLPGRPNPHSGAVGLIGFLPSTAIYLGTDTNQLQKMSVNEQLDYVYIYFKRQLKGRKMYKAIDVYLCIFSPIDMHKPLSTVVGERDTSYYKGKKVCRKHKVYTQNKIYDTDKDGRITIEEMTSFISML